ncbi:hypothetical protein, partial [Uliginosibacterium sp. 31-12]|uniref:hypothetical protein n=1 Tax=Uliginosibacterium sp. 31-12 TaxID=3062781 RepID=UPI0026E3848A
ATSVATSRSSPCKTARNTTASKPAAASASACAFRRSANGQVVSGSVQCARDSINHNYQSAVGQSGIFAGDSGFNLIVSGNTLLKGGALATTGTPSESRLKTASLTYEDLSNVQSTKSNSVSVSAG